MKKYVIHSSEKLREVLPMMKWQKEARDVESFIKFWAVTERKGDEKANTLSAQIEIGRSAQLFKVIGKKKTLLGTMHLPSVREFVKDMEAVK